MRRLCLLIALYAPLTPTVPAQDDERPPNVVFILSDELAYFELSHMGNPYLRTPRIDAMAEEGMRLTHAYAGAPVCAPLRCNLMTGKHAGHASVRANDGGTPLRAEEETIASLLQAQGYATGGFGKWGCGGRGSTGVPEKHGFDVFYGYYDQVHAHSFFPPYLVRNSEEVSLEGNIGGRSGASYSHYSIMDAGLEFIREHADEPFFCYLPITPPHGMYDIPADDPAWELYADDEWIRDPALSQDTKNYAAMVSMVDRNVGQVLDLLDELELADNTLVIFSGDNGGQDRFRSDAHPRGFYGPNVNPRTGVEFRGGKGNLYEGGLRVPFVVRWPGRIAPGQVSDLVFYQPDLLPTFSALCGAETPDDVDGRSILPTLLGTAEQPDPEFLYWEFGSQLAVRQGSVKAIARRKGRGPWAELLAGDELEWSLYDLASDPSEERDLAADSPERLARLVEIAQREHEPARPGSYTDRSAHERDRWAKWGTSPDRPQRNQQRKVHQLADGPGLIPASEIRVARVSSENTATGRLATLALDRDARTHWHTQFTDEVDGHPHEIVLDLQRVRSVKGLRYLARQDAGWNGAFGKVELYLADQPDGFPETPHASGVLQKKRTVQSLDLATPQRARYLRVRVLSEVNGGPWASAAELGIAIPE